MFCEALDLLGSGVTERLQYFFYFSVQTVSLSFFSRATEAIFTLLKFNLSDEEQGVRVTPICLLYNGNNPEDDSSCKVAYMARQVQEPIEICVLTETKQPNHPNELNEETLATIQENQIFAQIHVQNVELTEQCIIQHPT